MTSTTGTKTAYDGKHVIVHVIAPGENLTAIAGHYHLPHWESIWLYNTKVRQVYMGDDPNVIRPGGRLFIPRSPAGYDHLLRSLKKLRLEMENQGDATKYGLESQQNQYNAFTTALDFTSDVVTTLATFHLQAAKAAKASRLAKDTVGHGRVAAQYLADKEASKLSQWARDELIKQARAAAAEKADAAHTRRTGRNGPMVIANKTYGTGKKVINAVQTYGLQGGKTLLDIADIALDYLSPTKLANAVLWVSAGETVEQTFKSQKEQAEAIVKNSVGHLDGKIRRIGEERKRVYPENLNRTDSGMLAHPQHGHH